MKNFKEMKYLLLDLDGVCYGKHNNYSLEKVFGQVSQRMTMFISERLKIDMEEAKKLQTDYFYKYNTSLDAVNNGVKAVGIIDGRKKHSILFEIFSDKGSGTLIRK